MTSEHTIKICTACSTAKPLSEFYRNSNMISGYLNQCKACKRKYRADYFLENRERILEWFRNYPRPVSTKEKVKLWHRNHRDRVNASHRKMYHRNPEKYNARSTAYWKAHATEKLVHTRKRRALQYGSDGTHTKNQIDDLYQKQRGKCACCSKKLKKYHADHIVPLSKGGSNFIYNIQLLCPSCNLIKSNKDPVVHAQNIGRLI